MKHPATLVSILAIAACGGRWPGATPPKPPATTPSAPEPAPAAPQVASKPEPRPEPPAAPEPAPPPRARALRAKAKLEVGRKKLDGGIVTFAQDQGQPTVVASANWFVKPPGKYHLVVHEASQCGGKPGKPLPGGDIAFATTKGAHGFELGPIAALQLDGDAAITGHALVLHDDKRGKPGRQLSCGVITADD